MRLRNRNAFTLIELLVVIAIIAILAAILFPVFAQARAKARQTTCLSNEKQLGLATMMYVQDFDETYPIGEWVYSYSYSWGGQTYSYAYMASWTYVPPSKYDPYYWQELSMWENTIIPYVKSKGIYVCPDAITYNYAGGGDRYSYTYNGLLNTSTMAAVSAPAINPLFWEGEGKYASYANYGVYGTSPILDCINTPKACVYQASKPGCSGYGYGGDSYLDYASETFLHAQGQNFVMGDGHAKFRVLGPAGKSTYDWGNYGGTNGKYINDPKTQPWASYGSTGYAYYANYDKNNCHPYQFRLDFDGSN